MKTTPTINKHLNQCLILFCVLVAFIFVVTLHVEFLIPCLNMFKNLYHVCVFMCVCVGGGSIKEKVKNEMEEFVL